MIPRGISNTSVQNPTYEFQKRNISSIQENLSSIQNYQGLSFLPVTFPGLADLFPQLKSWHGQVCGGILYQLWWSSGKILAWDAGGPEFKSMVLCLWYFSLLHPWEPRFKSGFHNSLWDYVVPDRITGMTLELYEWNLGTSFG
jgi:hypothetical protein